MLVLVHIYIWDCLRWNEWWILWAYWVTGFSMVMILCKLTDTVIATERTLNTAPLVAPFCRIKKKKLIHMLLHVVFHKDGPKRDNGIRSSRYRSGPSRHKRSSHWRTEYWYDYSQLNHLRSGVCQEIQRVDKLFPVLEHLSKNMSY